MMTLPGKPWKSSFSIARSTDWRIFVRSEMSRRVTPRCSRASRSSDPMAIGRTRRRSAAESYTPDLLLRMSFVAADAATARISVVAP